MKLHRSFNPVAGENTYYIENDSHLLVVDPGSDWETIQATIEKIGKPVSAILLTHTHYDHILSLDLVRDTFGQPPVYVAQDEAHWLYTAELNGLARHPELPDIDFRPAEHVFSYGREYDLDGFAFTVLPTPGHSIGGVSFLFPEGEFVLTGDALFRGAIGRTDLPTGNLEDLLEGIRTQLFTLPGHYTAYPGHGRETTIAHECAFNPFFKS
ncbi:MBL fold metallo-hydrolase [Streptococcus gallinaceus]|uniref:Glyoxylase-like metal-dependent hydrolase (Beta-lactamase superfamily II) n=1 Tax=Streptococcus gallinaceus TaxID=165758 RepID=A0ABV2JJC7_9STRE|nr:MBL fold metallo-hydrolase [Streptococcus gallinaceus]MCP1639019.1 glyoxylase-like metal-dependent hydrolase (beta-lactamase superfamily II) [Streptococcus gallinaceus]MCP1769737.1 glyoxylase-like metal-dependent hydrolase (beta-lactamase superfamily II) [Streptococcus gallinaceus]